MYKARLVNSTDLVASFNSQSQSLKRIEDYSVQFNAVSANPSNIDFVDGDVTVGTDSIAETAHGFPTGLLVTLTTTGVLPAGLATSTNYYVIATSANAFKLASSYANAVAGTPVDITAAAGGGTHTVAVTALSAAVKLQASNDDSNWADISGSSNNITATSVININVASAGYKYVRAVYTHTAGALDLDVYITGKERRI